MNKILLVEDDPNLGELIKDYLVMQGFEVMHALDGVTGQQVFFGHNFDLLILDVMLPAKDGFTLAADIRKIDLRTPIIFLTARGDSADRIEGLKMGCDDYISKPFVSEELLLRIHAVLRRCQIRNEQSKPNQVKIGRYVFDRLNHELILDGEPRKLTTKEVALLHLLYQHRNSVITRETALTNIWGSNNYFIGRSMDVFITKLRKYLHDDPDVSIVNIHGTGFRLEIKET